MKKYILTILFCLITSFAFASNTGALSPGTVVDDATVGTVAWTNPNNAEVSDNVYAVRTLNNNVYSHYLKATNFGFSIPVGATINGILVEIEKKYAYTGAYTYDNSVKIVKSDGSFGATDKANASVWATSDTYVSYGASNDLWNEVWAYTDINNTNFGVVISAKNANGDEVPFGTTAYVDYICITVYYTAGGTQGVTSRINNAKINNAKIN